MPIESLKKEGSPSKNIGTHIIRQLKISDFKSALFNEKNSNGAPFSYKRKQVPTLIEKLSCKPPQRQVLLDEYCHISKM
jgi:hypothetical protein